MRGASVDFINLLSFEIVSEPSMTFVKAWLLIAISFCKDLGFQQFTSFSLPNYLRRLQQTGMNFLMAVGTN
jgi:hypothetical protein